MDFDTLANFYVHGYATVRASEYIASGSNEVMVVIHDAFQVRRLAKSAPGLLIL